MIETIPFVTAHALIIMKTWREAGNPEIVVNAAQCHEALGWGFTMIDGSTVIACGGIDTLWPGVGEAWTMLSGYIYQYRFSLHQKVKGYINECIEERNLHRVQAHVLKDDHISVRWITRLGFHSEGICEKYGPGGEDYILYARLN